MQPHSQMATGSPTGFGRLRYPGITIFGGDPRKGLWNDAKAGSLAHHVIQEFRSLEPPVTQEFGIVRCHDHRRASQCRCGLLELLLSVREEVHGMFLNGLQGGAAIVPSLFASSSGDSMIFQSAGRSDSSSGQKSRHRFPLGLIGQITMKFPVTRIPGISALPTPNLSGTPRISPEEREPTRTANRQENRRGRPRGSLEDSVGLQHGLPHPVCDQGSLQSGSPGTLRKPQAWRAIPEVTLVFSKTQTQLRSETRRFRSQ